MPLPKNLFLLAVAWVSLSAAQTTDYPQIAKLQIEAEKYVSSLKADQRARFESESLRGHIAQVGFDLASNNIEAADQGLRQLRQLLPTTQALELISELDSALRLARERRDAVATQTVQALVDRVGQTCLRATAIEEIDPLLLELAEFRDTLSRGYNSTALQQSLQKFEAACYFARRWQDYIDKKITGDARGAAQIMTELANNAQSFPIIPRSELLKRARLDTPSGKPEEAPVVAIKLSDFKPASLSAIPATLERLQPHLAKGRQVPEEVRTFAQQLRALQNGAQSAALGDYGRALQIAGNIGYNIPDVDNLLLQLRHELMLEVLPRQLEVPSDLAPAGDKSPADYLNRVITTAKAKSDWLLVLRAYDALANTIYSNSRAPDWVQQDRSALGFFIAGLNYEKAGEKQSALTAYGSALKMPSKILPVEEIAQRIKALSGNH